MASESDDLYIRQIFPELELIGDPKLANAIVDIWVEVWKESGWDAIENCPKNPLSFEMKLVPHIRSITQICVEFADVLKKFYPIKLNMNDLIAGSLLHDVDKLLVYSPFETKVVKRRFSKLLPHGTYTGYKMLEKGLSLDLVNLVVAHSEKATHTVPATLEGMIMKHVDHGESMVINMMLESGKNSAAEK